MKKIIFLILTLAYITSTSGATIYLHECMGKVIDWNIRETGDKCANCGMHKNKAGDCCKEIVKVYKLQTAHSIPLSDFHIFLTAVTPLTYFHQPTNIITTAGVSQTYYVSPPPKAAVSLFIYNCTFLI
ncbi:MAG: hypothetical protein ABI784_08100 [Ginsengibacter sp.]